MCTAINLTTRDHYFGRNLDLDVCYGEKICVMPRYYPIHFRQMGIMEEHFAMIGMAAVVENMPLYFDAVNEKGLAMAGLNFPGNAWYAPKSEKKGVDNIASFELIPWILSQCADTAEARKLMEKMNLYDESFSPEMPPSPLHWIISDKTASIVVESMRDGFKIYDNQAGILTNNPPLEYQLFNLNNYRGIGVDTGSNRFSPNLDMAVYCQGLGAVGLPGDVSSMSRFVRAVFNSHHSVCGEDEASSVSQFFHLLGSVEMVRGCCLTDSGHWDITQYSSCMNTDKGIYYYTTYENRQISQVDMHKANLADSQLVVYELMKEQQIYSQN